ncbi:MAG: hypothetical protein JWN52_3850 [Actinomycetia bacterium]|nr:hypothetical protein [Actinomycetes bacterium]
MSAISKTMVAALAGATRWTESASGPDLHAPA